MADWQGVSLPSGTKIFKVHSFTLIHLGNTYTLEIDEFPNGSFTGHGEHSADPSNVVESVTAPSLKECLDALVAKVQTKDGGA